MESIMINTRADLDALIGKPSHDAFMMMLQGSLWRLEKDDTAKTWRAVLDESTVVRFGLSLTDFPAATPPLLPDYVLPPTKTPDELRLIKYAKRYEAVKVIMSEFATENVGRLYTGEWTLSQLMGLMADSQLQELLNFINTLSFEIAIGKVQALTNPMITNSIKAGWSAKLQSHFYNA